jgi:hypothetical protein
MPEKKLTEQESLQVITDMINKVKNSYVESGIGPLYWGVVITFCSLVTFAEIEYGLVFPFDVWYLTFIALIPQVYFSWRSKRTRKFRSRDEDAMNFTWTGFAITIFLLIHYNTQFQVTSVASLFLLLYGIPTFITGGFKHFSPMIFGGIVCWVCCIISVYTTDATDMLLTALSAIAAWLIPGIILRRKYLKLKHV